MRGSAFSGAGLRGRRLLERGEPGGEAAEIGRLPCPGHHRARQGLGKVAGHAVTGRGLAQRRLLLAAARLGMLTFAIYILHFPLLYLAGALLTGLTPGPAKWALVVTGALLAAVTTGALVDRSRPGLRRWLVRLGRQALAAAPARGSSRLT